LLVIAEHAVPTEWMVAVSDWIVRSGCLFMMAWGTDCKDWHDSVIHVYLAHHDFGEEHFMLTTWHNDGPLNEVFWLAAVSASHPTVDLQFLTLLHIAPEPRGDEILAQYAAQRAAAGGDQDNANADALPRSHKV
jgi:hypothetical protein